MQIIDSIDRKVYFRAWLIKEKCMSIEIINALDKIDHVSGTLFNNSIFKVHESAIIREKTALYISQRDRLSSFSDYLCVVQLLLCYAEYLDTEDLLLKLGLIVRDKRTDSLSIAYYLSRVNKDGLQLLGFESFRDAFRAIGSLLGQKPATIKNMRDEFDPFFDNGRAGWYQRSISPTRKAILELFSNVSNEDLTRIVRYILGQYENKEIIESKKNNHKTIRINSSYMREIKTKY